MAAEEFCLKWNDHHSAFFSVAEELLEQEILADVTLATGKSSFPAHRLVLSICSTFFRRLFSKEGLSAANPSRCYYVYLKDISEKHLQMLISFMYRGEINCEEHDLPQFIAAARGLGVKGLSEVEEPPHSESPAKCDSPLKPRKKRKESGKRKREEFILGESTTSTPLLAEQTRLPVEEGEAAINPEVVMQEHREEKQTDAGQPGNGVVEVKTERVDDLMGNGEEPEENQPGTELGSAFNVLPGTLECPYCPKVFTSTYQLRRHVVCHEEKKYKCDYCEKLMSRKDNLMAHQRNVHGHLLPGGVPETLGSAANKLDAGAQSTS